ncbi:hypothetical protein ACFZB9_10830 [Kitasatospora sp. NPDC008050]|uniref:hypothetical protein n=1 Tax=Kitasatospora sp. NPDC008050 TaxID=3364021 RepID=UPI0036E13D3A
MSGSPMYSTVSVAAVRRAAEAERRRRQVAQRRRREEERARERARRAAARAEAQRRDRERQDRARAEADHRIAERERERAERVASVLWEQGEAASRSLQEVAGLITAVRAQAGAAAVLGLERQLAALRSRAPHQPDAALLAAVEELRGQAVALGTAGQARSRADSADHAVQLASFERQLALIGPTGAGLDPAGHRRCAELLDELRQALRGHQDLRAEALLGTVEHELARHAAAVDTARTAALTREREQRLAAEEQREAVRRREQEQQRAAEQDRRRAAELAAQLAEAADRLAVVAPAARDAAQDAGKRGEAALRARLLGALDQVTLAIDASQGAAALGAVSELERLLPEAEARLDELLLAYQRRAELAKALKAAMGHHGLELAHGDDAGPEFVLVFERAGGATYRTAVRSDAEGGALLTYTVQDESDDPVMSERGEVTCSPEALLDRVHAAMAEDGYQPGELDWDGKPPRGSARTRPGSRTGSGSRTGTGTGTGQQGDTSASQI